MYLFLACIYLSHVCIKLQPQVPGGYIVPFYDQNTPILMAQGAAMRNGTPMRLVSPAPVLVQPQAANRQNQAAAAAAVSLYSSTPQSLYGANVNTSVNGTTLGGRNTLSFSLFTRYL